MPALARPPGRSPALPAVLLGPAGLVLLLAAALMLGGGAPVAGALCLGTGLVLVIAGVQFLRAGRDRARRGRVSSASGGLPAG